MEDELRRLKQAVSSVPPLPIQPLGTPREIEELENLEKEGPALFVKIENYKNLISDIRGLKGKLSDIKELTKLIYEIEKTRADAGMQLSNSLERFNRALTEIEKRLPRATDERFIKSSDAAVLQSQLSSLEKELIRLKGELVSRRD